MSRIRILAISRVIGGFALAIVVPLLIARYLEVLPAVSPLFICIALAARFLGFEYAIAATVSSTIGLWTLVLPRDDDPLHLQFVRLVLFALAAIIVASVSRQRSKDVREAEERYRSLVDLAPDGIAVTDEQGTLVFANSGLARIVGAPDGAALVGRNSLDFLMPEERDEALDRLDRLTTGTATPWVRSKARRLDGTIVEVERAGVPVRAGGKLYAQGFIRDLTEQMEREAAIDASRRRLQALFDSSLDAIVFYDSQGNCVDVNPAAAALLGSPREEIRNKRVGKPLDGLVDGAPTTGEAMLTGADGAQRVVEFRRVQHVLPDLHILLMHDVTEQKKAERVIRVLSARLLRAQDAEQRRLAKLLHETTAQNMAAIRLNLASIQRSQSMTDARVQGLLQESMDFTEQVIAELRTLSYLLHPPFIEEGGLAAALGWYTAGFSSRSGIRVTLEVPETLRLAPEVETSLFRIVQEALTNIQRHSGSATARITLEKKAPDVVLTIADEGRGLPHALREQENALFAAGVGMAAMRERVQELGGSLRIESGDHGTTVIVRVPRASRNVH